MGFIVLVLQLAFNDREVKITQSALLTRQARGMYRVERSR
jgi:hypothetical protein